VGEGWCRERDANGAANVTFGATIVTFGATIVTFGATIVTPYIDDGGCWGDDSRCGWMSSGCDERTLWVRAMRRGEGWRLVTPLAVLAAR